MVKKRIFIPILALCTLVVAALTLACISPPAPLPAGAPATVFSAGRAMQDLAVMGRELHPLGEFPAHAAVRDDLLTEVRSLSLQPQVQDTFGLCVVHPTGARQDAIARRVRPGRPGGFHRHLPPICGIRLPRTVINAP